MPRVVSAFHAIHTTLFRGRTSQCHVYVGQGDVPSICLDKVQLLQDSKASKEEKDDQSE